jgi:hypothetical protein
MFVFIVIYWFLFNLLFSVIKYWLICEKFNWKDLLLQSIVLAGLILTHSILIYIIFNQS